MMPTREERSVQMVNGSSGTCRNRCSLKSSHRGRDTDLDVDGDQGVKVRTGD